MIDLSPREEQELARANRSGAQPVVFVHGLWLLASSWDRWRALFEERGYVTLAPAWPDDPETVEEAHLHPESFARKRIQQVVDHHAAVVALLARTPAIVGHSFGGLIAQVLAGRGLSAGAVAIDPAPFRGVLPLPLSALRAALPVLGNPANYRRAVELTYAQFRFAFANAVGEEEARRLHRAYAVAAPGAPLFQAAAANLNPWSAVKVDTTSPDRGPLLVISGEKDNTVPRAIAWATYRRQRRNPGITEFHEQPGRGHSLVIDAGWQEVAEAALAFVERHLPPTRAAPGWSGEGRAHADGPQPAAP